MKRIHILIILSVLLMSCSKTETSQITVFDFGKGEYEEPFRGILKSKPEILEKSLKYIPYKWLAPDTLYLNKSFIIEFNEDAIRSEANAVLTFVDNEYKPIKILSFYVNGEAISDNSFTVKADSLEKVLNVSCKVDPSLREMISGKLLLKSRELDLINSKSIQQEVTDLAVWTIEQEYNSPWILWFLWLISTILICVIAAVIVYYLCKWICMFVRYLIDFIPDLSHIRLNKINRTKKNKVVNKNDGNKNDYDDIIKTILILEGRLYTSAGIAYKYDTLEQIRQILDKLYEVNQEKYQMCRNKLKQNTWNALEDAWKLWDPTPNNGLKGMWGGFNNMTYTLNSMNPHYSECASKDFLMCTYDQHGSPDFSNVTVRDSIVNIEDLYERLTIDALTKRGGSSNSLQELAQQRMSEKLEPLIKQWAKKKGITYDPYDSFYKWRDENDLVPHEDTNCRTMRLVYRPAHKAFTHRGGIANAKNIKKHFM